MSEVGIYGYRDTLTNNIVYVGKDSNITKNKRHKDHTEKWAYGSQQINRVIQNNPERYKYEILKKGSFTENLLNALEIIYIRRYNPLFNFTIGGEINRGANHPSFKHYARVISDGKTIFALKYNGKKICSNKSKEFLSKIANKINNGIISVNKAKQLNRENYKKRCSELRKNKPHSKAHSFNICKSTNKTGFYRVSRCRDKYQYCYTQDKKRKTIVANNIKDLKEKVISKGLEWGIIDSEKAIKIMGGGLMCIILDM